MDNTEREQPAGVCGLCGGSGIVQRHPFINRCGCGAAAVKLPESAADERDSVRSSAWVGEGSRAHDANGGRLVECDHCKTPTPIDQPGGSYQAAGYMWGDGWEEWEDETMLCKECFAKLEAHIDAEVERLGLEAVNSPTD